jgi:pimeloyl-ACP methyl ester carboxylesterase
MSGDDGHRGNFVRANGIDIHSRPAGTGRPLLVLENGMISTNPIWGDWPSSYARHMRTLAARFQVVAPDFRGSGRTVHPGGPIPYPLLADDVSALIGALRLDRPLICGYGDGGVVATILGIRDPGSVRAIVNHAGYLFDPDPLAPPLVLTRRMLGGRADATRADPDAVANSELLGVMVDLMKADHDLAQGAGHWRTVLHQTFDRVSQPSGYTFEDLRAVTAPTLILVGDRDPLSPIEVGVTAYRALPDGELAVLPGNQGGVSPASVAAMIEFFERRGGDRG